TAAPNAPMAVSGSIVSRLSYAHVQTARKREGFSCLGCWVIGRCSAALSGLGTVKGGDDATPHAPIAANKSRPKAGARFHLRTVSDLETLLQICLGRSDYYTETGTRPHKVAS